MIWPGLLDGRDKNTKNIKKRMAKIHIIEVNINQPNKAFVNMHLNPIDYDEQLTYYNKDFCNNHQTS